MLESVGGSVRGTLCWFVVLVVVSEAAVSCGITRHDPEPMPAVLLLNASGASPNDVSAIERIFHDQHIGYSTATSAEVNRTDSSQLRRYRLLVVPGGNFVEMGRSLTPEAIASVREAVEGGMSYLGICAGAFLAGQYDAPYNSFNFTSGVRFGFYEAEQRGIRKAAVPITVSGAPTLEHYWEDGPELSGWGSVVGRYPDGTPAIVEGRFGEGWIVLSGVHPEAPESWRRGMVFCTPASASQAYAATLIRAALSRTSLVH